MIIESMDMLPVQFSMIKTPYNGLVNPYLIKAHKYYYQCTDDCMYFKNKIMMSFNFMVIEC